MLLPRPHQFGLEDARTQESSLCLKELTGKAVTMQKTVSLSVKC